MRKHFYILAVIKRIRNITTEYELDKSIKCTGIWYEHVFFLSWKDTLKLNLKIT